jgi:hypothetical protein
MGNGDGREWGDHDFKPFFFCTRRWGTASLRAHTRPQKAASWTRCGPCGPVQDVHGPSPDKALVSHYAHITPHTHHTHTHTPLTHTTPKRNFTAVLIRVVTPWGRFYTRGTVG